ncbi:MAG: hypothetical protein HFJ80_04460 [Clostridiales bacterium]|nr:hypothetical protein [Clostridiales bacterium]
MKIKRRVFSSGRRRVGAALLTAAMLLTAAGPAGVQALPAEKDWFPACSIASEGERALGCIPDSEETIERLLLPETPAVQSRAALPPTVDMTSQFPTPGNQGSQGSCTAWAVAYALKSYQEKQDHSWAGGTRLTTFCPAYVYNQMNGGENRGTSISGAMKLIYEQGVCTYNSMSYNENDWTTQPSQAARREAARYRAISYGTVRGTEAIKKRLAQGDGVVIQIPVYPDFDNLNSSNPIYNDLSGKDRGSHAVCLIGYDDSKKAFKLINSWGTSWGLGGYGYISYDLVTTGYVMTDEISNRQKIKEVGAGDFNGDGKDEIVALVDYKHAWTQIYQWKRGESRPTVVYGLYEHTGFNLNSVAGRTAVGDFNGDGKDDIVCMYDYGNLENTLHVFLSNGAGFLPNQWWYNNTQYNAEKVGGRLVSGDFNGDGRDDVAALYDYDGQNEYSIHVWRSAGNSFSATQWWLDDRLYDVENVTNRVVSGDFNGDGKDDIAALYHYGGENEYAIHVWSSSGSSFSKPSWWLGDRQYNVNNVTGRVAVGDFNGDGKDDIAALYDYGGEGEYAIHVWSSSGSGFSKPSWWLSDRQYNVNHVTGRVAAGDFNGDGKDDIATVYCDGSSPYTAHVFESDGGAFRKPRSTV